MQRLLVLAMLLRAIAAHASPLASSPSSSFLPSSRTNSLPSQQGPSQLPTSPSSGSLAFAVLPSPRSALSCSASSPLPARSNFHNIANAQWRFQSSLPLRAAKPYRTVLPSLRAPAASSPLRMATSSAVATEQPVEKFRKDYKEPDYWVRNVDLLIQIRDQQTTVTGKLKAERRQGAKESATLRLDAEDVEVVSVSLNGKPLSSSDYHFPEKDVLEITCSLPDKFELETVVKIKPEDNTQLSGLYKSSSMYCTQCEAEGFRRITPMLDRPDVMARYTVRIEADKKSCPVLLSNGNLVTKGDLGEGRHFAEWEDPFPKPSYLFAVVAGDLGSIKDSFTTKSGRKVALEIFSEHANVDQLDWAMQSLKDSMKWDEERFGLEYDLDVYNIVAVNDFNMGAMENKGLNVFNTACVLAKPSTATDSDYERVQGVIAHEYFHNWTGNRVTCRDWFQLTLKEGLTVFRDQQFSADMTSEAVKRIEDVRILRAAQFPQDDSPMAHPIRPESYIAMDNFYTATVYNKGAEVIGMYQTLLGKDGFRKGMDLYFKRHDGTAVTCDDFRAAMADANGVDLQQFERWYTQAGTPTVEAKTSYSPEKQRLELVLSQSCGPSPGQPTKEPYHIPVRVGLIGKDGKDLVPERVLELKDATQTFVFEGVKEEPVVSLLRGFSAPVNVKFPRSDEELAFLMANDQDSFNRWEAGQELFSRSILANARAFQQGKEMELPQVVVDAAKRTLLLKDIDKSLQAYALTFPSLLTLGAKMDVIDPDALVAACKFMKQGMATKLRGELEQGYKDNQLPLEPFRNDADAVGRRRIKNVCLDYLMTLKEDKYTKLCLDQALQSTAMTDLVAATALLAGSSDEAARKKALENFYEKHAKGNDLILCKWFTMQAMADVDSSLSDVGALLQHPDFSLKNPNKCRAVIGAFAGNMKHFHAADGSGYRWLSDRILDIDKMNPQMSARLVSSFSTFRRYDEKRQTLIKAELERLVGSSGLSRDAYEIASKSLKA